MTWGPLIPPGWIWKKNRVQGQAADHGEALPAKGFLDHRRLAAGRPGPYPVGRVLSPLSSMKTRGSALFAGFFYRRPLDPLPTAGSWARRARSRGAPGVGN